MISRIWDFTKERRKRLGRWIDTRIRGKSESHVQGIRIFVEGEDPITDLTEIFVSVDTDG